MIVKQLYTANAYRNFNYLIACPETGQALAVDPPDYRRCPMAIGGGPPCALTPNMFRRCRRCSLRKRVGGDARAPGQSAPSAPPGVAPVSGARASPVARFGRKLARARQPLFPGAHKADMLAELGRRRAALAAGGVTAAQEQAS